MSTIFYSADSYARMVAALNNEWMRSELPGLLRDMSMIATVNYLAFIDNYPKEEATTEPVTHDDIKQAFERIRYKPVVVDLESWKRLLSDIVLLRYNCNGLENKQESEALSWIENRATYTTLELIRCGRLAWIGATPTTQGANA